jgi:hypothetical protein
MRNNIRSTKVLFKYAKYVSGKTQIVKKVKIVSILFKKNFKIKNFDAWLRTIFV